MMRLRWIILIAALLLAASALAGIAQPRLGHAADTASKKTITVTGSGKVTTVPDRASFAFTVETRAETAKAALAKNAAAAAEVIAAVKNAGVAAADITTSQVALFPQTNEAGTLVDAAVEAGANGVSGPMLSRSDDDALYREALRGAVANANDKAEALASAAGLTLAGAETIVEGGQSSPPIIYAQKADAAGVSVPIEPGTQTIEANVTVTFAAS